MRNVILVLNHDGMRYLYEGKPLLTQCIAHLVKTNGVSDGTVKIVLIDNGSTDQSITWIKRSHPNIDVLPYPDNIQLTTRYNQGIKYALKRYHPDFVTIFSNDIFITDRDWLEKLSNVAESSKDIGIVGCKLLFPTGNIQNSGIRKSQFMRNHGKGAPGSEFSLIEDVESIHFGVMVIKASTFKKVGLLDEHFVIGFEDIDYCVSTKKKGLRVIYDGEVSCIHLEGFTIASVRNIDNIAERYDDRHTDKEKELKGFDRVQLNFLYYIDKHYTIAAKLLGFIWVIFGRSILTSAKLGPIGWKNVKLNDHILQRLIISLRAFQTLDSWKSQKAPEVKNE